MIDHFGINCADFDAAKTFYDGVLEVLGYGRVMDFGEAIGYGKDGSPDFWISHYEDQPAVQREMHIAFRAADKEAVEVHTQNRFRGLHVGTPYFDKLSQHWAVSISRRVSGQEGVPGRVVLAVLNLEYLHNFYQSIDMGTNGSISTSIAPPHESPAANADSSSMP